MNDLCLLFKSLGLMGGFQIPSVPSAAHLSTLPRPVASSRVGVVAPGRSFLLSDFTGQGWPRLATQLDLLGIVYLFFGWLNALFAYIYI